MDSPLLKSRQHHHHHHYHNLLHLPPNLMNPLSLTSILNLTLKPKTLLQFRLFCTSSSSSSSSSQRLKNPTEAKPSSISRVTLEILKRNWLSSLSCPPSSSSIGANGSVSNDGILGGYQWVIGVDPDLSGALALLKFDDFGCKSAQVFDSPFVQVSVGKRLRKRLDARSIVQLLQSFEAPSGTIAYVEQSTPFPQDGKQGWWSGGFGYGLWIGVLVASGFSVVPVPSIVWKKDLELASSRSSKDDSRELAAQLFPDLSPMLKRKKDHGRAEALLIAAYGKGHKLKPDQSSTPEMVDESSSETEPDESSLETEPDESSLETEPDELCVPDMNDKLSLDIETEMSNDDE